jgi:hypothetical protein
MKGCRKLILGLVYLGLMGAVGIIVARHAPHELSVVGLYAGGVATGLVAIVWGNRAEHQAPKA